MALPGPPGGGLALAGGQLRLGGGQAGGGPLAAAVELVQALGRGGRLPLQAAELLAGHGGPVVEAADGRLGVAQRPDRVGGPPLLGLQLVLGGPQLGPEPLQGRLRGRLGPGGLVGRPPRGQPARLGHHPALDPPRRQQLPGQGHHPPLRMPFQQLPGLVQVFGDQHPVQQPPGHLPGKPGRGHPVQQQRAPVAPRVDPCGQPREPLRPIGYPPGSGAHIRAGPEVRTRVGGWAGGVEEDGAAAAGVAEEAGAAGGDGGAGDDDGVGVGAEGGGDGGFVAGGDREGGGEGAEDAVAAGALQEGEGVAAGRPGGGFEGLAAGAAGGPFGLDPPLVGDQAAGGGGPLVALGVGRPAVGVPGRLLAFQLGPFGPEPFDLGGGLGPAPLQSGGLLAQPAGLGLHLLDRPFQAGDLAGQPDLALVGGGPVPFGPGGGLVEGGQGGPGPVAGGGGLGRGGGGGGQLGLDPGQLPADLAGLSLQVGHRAAVRLLGQRLGQMAGASLGQGHRAPEALAHGGQAVHGLPGPAGRRLQLGQLGLEAPLGSLPRRRGAAPARPAGRRRRPPRRPATPTARGPRPAPSTAG